MDTMLAEIDFYYRLVQVFFFLITAIIVLLIFVYHAMKRSSRTAEERTEYARLVVDAQEAERRRIARELHDTVAGGLRRLGFMLYQGEVPADEKRRTEAADYCDALIRETRNICQSLYPPDFSLLPFTASLQDLCVRFEERSGVPCVFSISHDFALDLLNALPVETRFQCFRIIQEALANIEKHARAGEAGIVIRRNEKNLFFIISDDGPGLPAGGISGGSGLGIQGMRDRAKLIGGDLALASSPGAGLMLTLRVPMVSVTK
jgi:signal transduction histidine kinase